jgi:hypothetical protein
MSSCYLAGKALLYKITKINALLLCREIISVYSENHIKLTDVIYGLNAEIVYFRVGGNHRVLKD